MKSNSERKEFQNESHKEFDLGKLQEIEDLKKRLDNATKRQLTEKEKFDNIFYRQGRTLEEQNNNLKLNQLILTIIFILVAFLAVYSCLQLFI
jgi:molecular chaperone GrpE (heat shock protein)